MRATKLEFQLRMAINAAIIILGFWAPWIDAWGFGKRISLLEWLPLELSRLGLFSFTVASPRRHRRRRAHRRGGRSLARLGNGLPGTRHRAQRAK